MPLATTTGTEDRFQNSELRAAVLGARTSTVSLTSSTATAGAVTLNAGFGKITSDVLSLAGATEFVLTVTNTVVTSTDLVFANLQNGTNTVTPGPHISSATAGAGVMTIRIVNENVTAAVNGTVIVDFMVVKQQGAIPVAP